MEPIKVSVDVVVDFSESTKTFIQSLLSSQVANPAPMPPACKAAKPATEAPAKPATEVPAKPATEAPAKPATEVPAKPATEAPAKPVSTITIEDVRKALSEKVNAHRSEIKDKLNELGAPSVTKLDKSKYQEMFDFLTALD